MGHTWGYDEAILAKLELGVLVVVANNLAPAKGAIERREVFWDELCAKGVVEAPDEVGLERCQLGEREAQVGTSSATRMDLGENMAGKKHKFSLDWAQLNDDHMTAMMRDGDDACDRASCKRRPQDGKQDPDSDIVDCICGDTVWAGPGVGDGEAQVDPKVLESDQIGGVGGCGGGGGGEMGVQGRDERVLTGAALEHFMTYSVIETEGERKYSSVLNQIRLFPVTSGAQEGSTFVQWSVQFSGDADVGRALQTAGCAGGPWEGAGKVVGCMHVLNGIVCVGVPADVRRDRGPGRVGGPRGAREACTRPSPMSVPCAAMSDEEQAERQKAIDTFLARTEFSKLARVLRARLAYASYKATHNVAHVPLTSLEGQLASRPPPPPDPPRRLLHTAPMPPPADGPRLWRSAGMSLYHAVLDPPPGPRRTATGRTVRNARRRTQPATEREDITAATTLTAIMRAATTRSAAAPTRSAAAPARALAAPARPAPRTPARAQPDDEAAELMLFLATSPSPARQANQPRYSPDPLARRLFHPLSN
ncbi:hypothetical protein CTheo_2580 [Ceratobasidium theobromae]|uniref:Uncharacterized protein n=1 Tax=Ceratobasidium theobromae TaxID=1582974 RepID=A0A5N5QQQ8_9AGAM|nr:hypothetical protein CTheo_2580 [Ceratobasidium theobromae]